MEAALVLHLVSVTASEPNSAELEVRAAPLSRARVNTPADKHSSPSTSSAPSPQGHPVPDCVRCGRAPVCVSG